MEKILFSLIFISQYLIKYVSPQCQCSGLLSAPAMTVPTEYAGENEIVNGVNYGVPVALNGMLFLQQDFNISKSTQFLNASCPLGWRVPTVEELRSLLSTPVATLKSKLNLTEDNTYYSSNKSFPGVTEGTNNDAWNYKGFTFSSKSNNLTIDDQNVFFDNAGYVKCIFDASSNILLKIYQKDFYQNTNYPVSVARTNLPTLSWKVNGNILSTKEISVNFPNTGCNAIEVWAKNAVGQTLYNCRQIWVTTQFGSDGTTTKLDIKEVDSTIKAERMIHLFWNRGNAPIAPKPSGGFYMLYTESPTNDTYVAEYSATFSQVTKSKIWSQAYPMDITATDNGFVVYLKDCQDNNKAWVATYDSAFKQVSARTIMNNGITPSQIRDQTSFYNDKGQILGGLEAMFAASSGKLAYGRGRFGLFFAHYNAFGTANARDDHQGDTFYTGSTATNQFAYAWTWKTSHSLQQSQIYTGRYFLTASLGDVYPENIKVCVVDATSYTKSFDSVNRGNFEHPSNCIDIVKGKICGDGGGKTCGRIGGLVNMGDVFGLVYVRKACAFSGYKGVATSSTDSEIGLITFQINNFQLTNMKYYTFGKGDLVTAIRAGKYGNNIYISYLTVKDSTGNEPQTPYVVGDKLVETQNNMLVDFNGNVIVQPTVFSGNLNVNPTDDIRYLADGTPVWTYIDTNNKLMIYYQPAPPKKLDIKTDGEVDSVISSGSSGTGGSGSGSGGSGSSSFKIEFGFILAILALILII